MNEATLSPNAVSGRQLMTQAEELWGPLCCIRCYEAKHRPGTWAWISRPMLLCRDCGCKRCPKATDHNLACTDSNEPGQPGSDYA